MLPYYSIVILGFLYISARAKDIPSTNSTNPEPPEEEDDAYIPNLTWSDPFDWILLKALCNPDSRNLLISPISLKLALTLLYEGSSGTTEKEFHRVLQFNPKKEETRQQTVEILKLLKPSERKQYVLNLGTRIFLDTPIKPQANYSALIKEFYDADIEPTNFAQPQESSKTINSWIDKITNGRIQQIVRPDDVQAASMVLANAIFFKGTWRHQFPKNRTKTGGFYVSPDHVVEVPFMSTTDMFYYVDSPELDAKILRLPYKGRKYSLIMVLPKSKGGLPDLVKKIDLMNIKQAMFSLNPVKVDVFIPKFKFNFQASMAQTLRDFGLREMFQSTASFSGMVEGGLSSFAVSDVIQKTGIELDEEGSVVYSASAISLINKFGEADNVFNASHPFLFFVEEQDSGTILFLGKLVNPLEDEPKPLPTRIGENQPLSETLPPPITVMTVPSPGKKVRKYLTQITPKGFKIISVEE